MTFTAPDSRSALAAAILPGLLLSCAVAAASALAERGLTALTGERAVLPAVVIALLIGLALNRIAARRRFSAGLEFAVKRLLRWAIALLGVRVALSDIAGLGLATILLVLAAMTATIAVAIALSRRLGLGDGYGALAGAATAICGASATLATATVVPNYPSRSADIAFTVAAANGVSTIAMLAYPLLGSMIGLSASDHAVFLGATIHDMAQVVVAGYAVGDGVGNGAVVVKLFRVFLLLPVVMCLGWWLGSRSVAAAAAGTSVRVPTPIFAIAFLLLAAFNSIATDIPAVAGAYLAVKPWLVQASNAGLLVAIAALGLATTFGTLAQIGWRHLAVFLAATVTILSLTLVGLSAMRAGA